MKYRKTALIEAEQFDGSQKMIEKYSMQEIPRLIGNARKWRIDALAGYTMAHVGDWIATGIDGEHWAISDDIFKRTHEAVDDLNLPANEELKRRITADMLEASLEKTKHKRWHHCALGNHHLAEPSARDDGGREMKILKIVAVIAVKTISKEVGKLQIVGEEWSFLNPTSA